MKGKFRWSVLVCCMVETYIRKCVNYLTTKADVPSQCPASTPNSSRSLFGIECSFISRSACRILYHINHLNILPKVAAVRNCAVWIDGPRSIMYELLKMKRTNGMWKPLNYKQNRHLRERWGVLFPTNVFQNMSKNRPTFQVTMRIFKYHVALSRSVVVTYNARFSNTKPCTTGISAHSLPSPWLQNQNINIFFTLVSNMNLSVFNLAEGYDACHIFFRWNQIVPWLRGIALKT